MDVEGLQDLLEHGIQEWSVPGAQIGLRRGTERAVICAGVTGIDDATSVTATTSFHAGSITKSLVGLVALDAARRGQIDLDVSCDARGGARLWSETPRSILAQTTGRPNVLPDAGETLDEFVARTAAMPLLHEPGRFSYCNAGWPALDLLLERMTGRGFEEAAQALLGPLQFGIPDRAAAGHQVSPRGRPVTVPHDDHVVSSAAGSRWFVTADVLLDYAGVYLGHSDAEVHPDDVRAVRTPVAELPGHTVFDAWGMGFGVWDRGDHQAFGWAGYTSGHRTYLRCFPEQDAALLVLTSCAGPLLGPPGGAALFDTLLPVLVEALGVPAIPDPRYRVETPARRLAGQYGPLVVSADDDGTLLVDGRAMGAEAGMRCRRLGGDTFTTADAGGMPFSFDGNLLYLGPFAMPRAG